MTNHRDIIELVKELQAYWKELEATEDLDSEISNNFTVIAQTLLDAISAMEQARYQMDFSPPSLKLENARKPVNDFLSRIESPSAS